MVTTNFRNKVCMQPMKWLNFMPLESFFLRREEVWAYKFKKTIVPTCVAMMYPKMFPTTPHFYPMRFAQSLPFSPTKVGQRKSTTSYTSYILWTHYNHHTWIHETHHFTFLECQLLISYYKNTNPLQPLIIVSKLYTFSSQHTPLKIIMYTKRSTP
jgi:hypothetical protein